MPKEKMTKILNGYRRRVQARLLTLEIINRAAERYI